MSLEEGSLLEPAINVVNILKLNVGIEESVVVCSVSTLGLLGGAVIRYWYRKSS